MFKIDFLEIKDAPNANKDLYKNLKMMKYRFHADEKISKYWESYINIQAIVGKNGSGKSTLMELLYMAINNFAYLFERGHHRAAASSLCFVKGLYVDVGYTLDGKEYVLSCSGDGVQLCIPLEKKVIADLKINTYNARKNEIEDEKIREIIKNFFYTIVSNYSLQAFNSSNYFCNTYVYNRKKHVDDESYNVDSGGWPLRKKNWEKESKEKIWINSVFHKNDGYVRSLVLNPYRDNGLINMEIEIQLAKYRIVALLIDGEKRKRTIFRDYSLDRIYFSLDENYIRRKFSNQTKKDVIKNILDKLENHDRELLTIINAFNIRINLSSSESRIIALAYLQKKIDKIIGIYDSYKEYRKKGTYSIYGLRNVNLKNNYIRLVEQIEEDPSHIVSKVKQTINFLKKSKDSMKNIDECFDYRWYSNPNYGNFVESFMSLDDIINSFPPPIFKFEVYLNRLVDLNLDKYKDDEKFLGVKNVEEMETVIPASEGYYFISKKSGMIKLGTKQKKYVKQNIIIKWNGKNWEKDKINLNKLSSGELQMMHTLSTHAYHIRNLISISQDKIKYYNINLVFDEAEICFHPEYQRQFISRLIEMLRVLKNVNRQRCCFNVFILTHSPFILSDLPSSNVLYMDNGNVGIIDSEVLGQNISVLLNQNFFLKFYVGEYVKNRINSLIEYLLTKKRTLGWNKDLAKKFINSVGDELLKLKLDEKYKEVFGDCDNV